MSFAEVASFTWSARGEDWNASMEIWNGTSAMNDIIITQGRRRLGNERMNPLNPRLPATLHTKIYDPGRTIYDFIKNNDANDIRLTVRKDTAGSNVIWHQGLFKKLTGGEAVLPSGPTLDVVWNDGLTRLRKVAANEQGRKSLFDTIHTCLQSARTDLTTRVSIAWQDTNMTTSPARSVTIEHDTGRQVSSGGSRWDILMDICRLYNMQVWQNEDKWYVLQRSYRDTSYSYEWREEDQAGNTSTGTTDPTATVTDADWGEVEGRTDKVERRWLPPVSYKTTFDFNAREWRNDDFNASLDEFGTTNAQAEAWPHGEPPISNPVNTVNYTSTSIEVDTTTNADPENSRYAQQWYETPLLKFAGNADSFLLQLKGDIDITDNASSDQSVAVAEVSIWHRGGTVQYADQDANFQTTQQFAKAEAITPPSSGTATRSYDFSINATLPGGDDEDWALRVRLLAEDTASAGNPVIIDRVEHTLAQLDITENADSGEPVQSYTYMTQVGGDQESETLNIGSMVEESRLLKQEVHAPSCGIAFEDTNNSYRLLEDLEHVERGYTPSNTSMHEMRMRDRLAQHNQQIQRIDGLLEYSKAQPEDTIVYDSKDWTPVFFDEDMFKKDRTVGAIELGDFSFNTADVVIEGDT